MFKNKLSELSVFFPCYNEEKNIANTVNKAIPVIKEVAAKWEIIIINDGSKDKTGEVALSLQKKYPKNIRVITLNPNRGYGAAFKTGFYNAKYKWITFTDADGQFDFSEIKNFIKKQKETNADLVIGYYLKRQASKSVILTSKLWEMLIFILFGLHVKDVDCAFKFVSKKVIDKIPKLEAERGAFISSEFLIKSKRAGFKIEEVGIHHFARTEGQATGRNIKVIIKSFTDLFRLWFKINFKK